MTTQLQRELVKLLAAVRPPYHIISQRQRKVLRFITHLDLPPALPRPLPLPLPSPGCPRPGCMGPCWGSIPLRSPGGTPGAVSGVLHVPQGFPHVPRRTPEAVWGLLVVRGPSRVAPGILPWIPHGVERVPDGIPGTSQLVSRAASQVLSGIPQGVPGVSHEVP